MDVRSIMRPTMQFPLALVALTVIPYLGAGAQAVRRQLDEYLFQYQNWESGSFMDRPINVPDLGSPVTTFPYTERDSQRWGYNSSVLPDGSFLIALSVPLYSIYADRHYVSVKDHKLTIEREPTWFNMTQLPSEDNELVYLFHLPGTRLALTASRVHGAQLTLKRLDAQNPLQHWRVYVPCGYACHPPARF